MNKQIRIVRKKTWTGRAAMMFLHNQLLYCAEVQSLTNDDYEKLSKRKDLIHIAAVSQGCAAWVAQAL